MRPRYPQLFHQEYNDPLGGSAKQKNHLQMCIFILALVTTNALTLSWSYWSSDRARSSSALAQVDDLRSLERRFLWNTPYSSQNRTQSDELWERILPSHGFVSVDREWAAKGNWPVTGYLPSDHTKGVYLLEAYHQLHCLKIIRKTFWEAVDHKHLTYQPGPHMDHCFDALRQSVQCNADNTPLYSFGDNSAGDRQLHQCKDWTELRDYATQYTACYRDSVENIPLEDHFGYCDDGDDGLQNL